jgi:hypothetical protein
MPNEPRAALAADQDIESRLTVVQQAVNDLVDTEFIVEDIENELDILAEEDADPEALGAIHSHAVTLLDAQTRLNAAFQTALELAAALKSQRESARQSLVELKAAIANIDTDVPEINDLWLSAEESASEWLMYSLYDEWETVVEQLINTTPLEEDEASKLIGVLTDEFDPEHYLWDELRDWIRRMDETIRTGITPPIGVDTD